MAQKRKMGRDALSAAHFFFDATGATVSASLIQMLRFSGPARAPAFLPGVLVPVPGHAPRAFGHSTRPSIVAGSCVIPSASERAVAEISGPASAPSPVREAGDLRRKECPARIHLR